MTIKNAAPMTTHATRHIQLGKERNPGIPGTTRSTMKKMENRKPSAPMIS